MQKEHDPDKVRQKVNAGLTREQAIAVLDLQAEHDAQSTGREKKPAKTGSAEK
jgi:hypothetical protein